MTDIKRLAIEIFTVACLYDEENCQQDNSESKNLKKLMALSKELTGEIRPLLKPESL